MGHPTSSLILLTGGHPAFCQSGGRQQGKGGGGGSALVPWREQHAHPDPATLSSPLQTRASLRPPLPTGKLTAQGAGARECSPERHGICSSADRGAITKLWTLLPCPALASLSNSLSGIGNGSLTRTTGKLSALRPTLQGQRKSQKGASLLIWRVLHQQL